MTVHEKDSDIDREEIRRTGDGTGLGHGARNYMRREDGSWGTLPVVLGIVFLVVAGLMFMDRGTDRANQTGASNTTTTNAPGTTRLPSDTRPK